jgi:hypothetical protein
MVGGLWRKLEIQFNFILLRKKCIILQDLESSQTVPRPFEGSFFHVCELDSIKL